MALWAPLELATLTAALLALPVAPALFELRNRADAAPLPTSRHDGRIANFAEVLQSRLEPLRPRLEQCRATGEISRTCAEGMEVLLVGCKPEDFDFDPARMQGVAAVMCSQDALIPAGRVVDADVGANGNLELGESAALRAAIATSDIVLGKHSAVLRWLHADGSIRLRQGSAAYGRLSAGQSIHLEPGCGFQRMYAPQIVTVDAGQADPASVLPTYGRYSAADISDVFSSSRQRIRVQADFALPAGETLEANVIATGEVRVGAGARFFGSAKSYKDTVVEEDACVHGSLICGGTVRLGARCFVAGPVMAEGDVIISRGSCVGAPDALTTISCSRAKIAAGCQIHGTVWARVQGNVEG